MRRGGSQEEEIETKRVLRGKAMSQEETEMRRILRGKAASPNAHLISSVPSLPVYTSAFT